MKQKVLYSELTPQEFRERLEAAPIAYLPLGTLEWHGEHLPLGADGIQSQGFFCRLAERVGGIVLPMLFLGPDRAQVESGREFYGMDLCAADRESRGNTCQQLTGSAYWIAGETFGSLLEGILKQLRRAGFKVVVGHGHGPSTTFFGDHAAAWKEEFGLVCMHCWADKDDPVYGDGDCGIQLDHAAKNETSLVMALRPDLVQMARLPQDPEKWPFGISGTDPRTEASAEVGERAISLQLERMSNVLREALAKLL
jgi:creatinine amidohydrolase